MGFEVNAKKTGLIECGFTFGNRFREFFSEQTGISPFRFNVDMVATAKAVKANGDESFTLGDRAMDEREAQLILVYAKANDISNLLKDSYKFDKNGICTTKKCGTFPTSK